MLSFIEAMARHRHGLCEKYRVIHRHHTHKVHFLVVVNLVTTLPNKKHPICSEKNFDPVYSPPLFVSSNPPILYPAKSSVT
jgi:hypothetical protein